MNQLKLSMHHARLYYIISLSCQCQPLFSGELNAPPTHSPQDTHNEVLKKKMILSQASSFKILYGLPIVLGIKTNIVRSPSEALYLLVSGHQNSCRPWEGLRALHRLFPPPPQRFLLSQTTTETSLPQRPSWTPRPGQLPTTCAAALCPFSVNPYYSYNFTCFRVVI